MSRAGSSACTWANESARQASRQDCPVGSVAACDRVLVVHTYIFVLGWALDVQAKLLGTGAFAAVDILDGNAGTPTLAQLAAYDAVLVSSEADFADASLLGDRLAAYHDGGGGVVVAYGATHVASGLRWSQAVRGAYGTPERGYALLDYASGGYMGPPDSLGEVLEPQSPLMAGVASLAASGAVRSTAAVVAGRGIVVARWSSGGREPLVLRGAKGDRTLVELNFHPVSSSIESIFWTGDGAALMRNALKYSRCMPCGPGTFAAAGAGVCVGEGGCTCER